MAQKNSQITIRLREETAERFKTIAQNNNQSQSALFESLLNLYGISQNEPINPNSIQIALVKKNHFNPEDKKNNLSTMKICFQGKVLYYPPQLFSTPASQYAEALYEEFQIDISLKNHTLYHVINLYFNNKTNSYFANEVLYLQENTTPSNNLIEVSRGCFVNTFKELKEKFKHYVHPHNLNQLDRIMAIDIREDYSLLDQFF